MTASDDEAFVRARWPDSAAWYMPGVDISIFAPCDAMAAYFLGSGTTEPAAWADAAKRIREAADASA